MPSLAAYYSICFDPHIESLVVLFQTFKHQALEKTELQATELAEVYVNIYHPSRAAPFKKNANLDNTG